MVIRSMASRFGQFADPSAPPADLFNIWRDDYMLSPQQAAAEAAERAQNTLFDGVLPPFSNVGNTDRDLGENHHFSDKFLLSDGLIHAKLKQTM